MLLLIFQARGVNLSCVRTCCVISEERPRIQLTTSFTKLFANLGLSLRAVSTSFGCRVNLGMCLQVRHKISTSNSNHINGVMVSVQASSPVRCGFEVGRVKPKTLKLVFVPSPLNMQH